MTAYSTASRPCRSCFGCSSRRLRTTVRSEEHTSELQSQSNLVCRLLLEKKNISRVRVRHLPYRIRGLARHPGGRLLSRRHADRPPDPSLWKRSHAPPLRPRGRELFDGA